MKMNDFMYEPRCPKCKDAGWITNGDHEYPCECQVSDIEFAIARDLEDEDYER